MEAKETTTNTDSQTKFENLVITWENFDSFLKAVLFPKDTSFCISYF